MREASWATVEMATAVVATVAEEKVVGWPVEPTGAGWKAVGAMAAELKEASRVGKTEAARAAVRGEEKAESTAVAALAEVLVAEPRVEHSAERMVARTGVADAVGAGRAEALAGAEVAAPAAGLDE